jgi:Uma2 family endonuclease
MSVQLARKLFTTTDYHRMIEAGVFTEDDRVELIDGKIIEMFAIGPRHAACVDRLAEFLRDKVRKLAIVRVQNPVQLNEYSELEPDIALLKRRADFYAQDHPTSADVLIAIEVSDTSVEKDRELKLPAYARAAISEVWLVDLLSERVEIHTQPEQGVYREVRIVLRGNKVVSRAIPQLKLNADDVLG